MGRFEPDFEKVRATTRVFERSEAELIIGEPDPFAYIRDSDGKEIAGVRFPLTMGGILDDDGNITDLYQGEDVFPHNVFVHSEKAWRMGKQFLMAAYGYARNTEETFNAEIASQKSAAVEGQDEEVSCGDLYADLQGKRVRVTLDVRLYTPEEGGESTEQQQFKAWRPA